MPESWRATVADYARWQRRGYDALGDLLKAGLPPIDWSVSVHASLVGRVHQWDGRTPDEQRDIWQRWVTHVGATPWTSLPPHRLHAYREGWGKQRVNIAIVANLPEPEEEP